MATFVSGKWRSEGIGVEFRGQERWLCWPSRSPKMALWTFLTAPVKKMLADAVRDALQRERDQTLAAVR